MLTPVTECTVHSDENPVHSDENPLLKSVENAKQMIRYSLTSFGLPTTKVLKREQLFLL